MMASLEGRLDKVESAIGESQDRLHALGSQMEELQGNMGDLESQFEDVRDELLGTLNRVVDTMRKEMEAFRATMMEDFTQLRERVEEMKDDFRLMKRAMTTGGVTTGGTAKVRTPEPRTFDGSRDARELENFLWQMEQYFEAISLEDEKAKVRTATMYLRDTATLWWRRRHGDMERGRCAIDTWEDFKREIKRQFSPENVEFLARRNLKQLKHRGSIRDYVKEFTSLMLEVPDMPEKELLFHFVDGLLHWAQQELQRRGVQDLATAIATAESLIEFTSRPKSPRREDHESGGGVRDENSHHKNGSGKPSRERDGKGRRK